MRAGRRRLIVLLALTLALTACPRSQPEEGPPQLGDRKIRGGVLKVALRDLSTLDPAKAKGRGAFTVISQVFDSLTAIDPVTGALQPAAAASWRTSKSGKVWTFRLAVRRYHDGRRVVARDFKRAFDRIARKRTDSDAAFQLEQVVGFRAAHTTGKAKTLAGVTSKGNVLTIKLLRPFGELPYFLAHPALAPLAPRYHKSIKGLGSKPVGNGPFSVPSAATDTSVTLAVHEAYQGGEAYLDGVEFTVVRSLDEGWELFGDGDGSVHIADVPARALAAARARYTAGGFTPVWATLVFGPNLRLAKYKKPEVRRAMSLAIDRSAIAQTVYGNTKDPATGLLPTGVRGFAPDACTVCEMDVARARSIIKAAFGKKPPTVRVDHIRDEASKQVATVVANNLRAIGLKARLRSYTSRAYFKLLSSGSPDFAELGWIADVPTPDGFLAQQLRTGSTNNATGFRNNRFDELVAKARKTRDEKRRLALYRQAEKRALAFMPLIPIVFFRNRTAASDRVHDFILDGAGLFDASKVWLSS